MTSLILLSAALATLSAGPLDPSSSRGPLRPSQGTFGAHPAARPAPAFPAPRTPPATPGVRMADPPGVIGADRFKPYQGRSVYSNRGGVDAYPKPAKPKGYLDPRSRPGF
jgi:hypothetical protein